jgi:hypothetical protein
MADDNRSAPGHEIDDAFSEWDENAPVIQIAQGSQPHTLPAVSRAVTVSDPVTTRALAEATRRYVPRSLEEALLALADGLVALADSMPKPVR